MYLNSNRPGVVYGHRLAGPTSKAISLVESPVQASQSGGKNLSTALFLRNGNMGYSRIS